VFNDGHVYLNQIVKVVFYVSQDTTPNPFCILKATMMGIHLTKTMVVKWLGLYVWKVSPNFFGILI
jgi:hypothetical protein